VNALLFRNEQSKYGTFGGLYLEGMGRFCYTAEPPWRNNRPNLSCIPEGDYKVVMRFSPKYGWVYWITDVVDRTWILIHPGNYAGDRKLDLKTHTYGCLLLGRKIGWLGRQKAVLVSRATVLRFNSLMNRQPFRLRIINMYKYVDIHRDETLD